MPSVSQVQRIARPVLSDPPALSARGQRSLVRPPLLRCSLFNCQYNACLNQTGLLNLGVAENVSRMAAPEDATGLRPNEIT